MRSKTEGRLTQTALRDVTNGAGVLYQEAFSQIKKEIAQMIMHVDMPVAARDVLVGKVDTLQMNVFDGLESEHLQEKFYMDKFGYLVCLLFIYIQLFLCLGVSLGMHACFKFYAFTFHCGMLLCCASPHRRKFLVTVWCKGGTL